MITDNQLIVYDVETPANCFILCTYEPTTNTKVEFKITEEEGDIMDVFKYMDDNKGKYWVSWNGIGFDNQVLEAIWKKRAEMKHMTNREIIDWIYDFSQDVIKVTRHGGYHRYSERKMTFKPIDLFKLHHFDNKMRMSNGGLKNMEYYLGMDIDTYEFDFSKTTIDEEELEIITKYCHHDVYATWLMYLLTRGRVNELPKFVPQWIKDLHEDNDQIQMRIDIGESFDIPCLNWSTTRIGTEITKQYYCKEKGIEIKDLPKKGMFRKNVKLKHCIPDYIQFETPEYQKILEDLKATVITEDEKIEHKVPLAMTNLYATIAKGGIHSTNKWNKFESNSEYMIVDADVDNAASRKLERA
jgi:predicted PolB exonuclease-like 3'-5' exonuclease